MKSSALTQSLADFFTAQKEDALAVTVDFPCPEQSISGLTRTSENPRILEIHFAAVPTEDELINTWLHVKHFVPGTQRPKGWEPTGKDGTEWEEAPKS